MSDTVELALGGIAGLLVVVLAYGFLFAALDAAGLGVALLALVAVVAAAVVRRRRGGEPTL